MKRLIPAVLILMLITLLTGCEMTTRTVIHTVTFYDGFGSSFSKEVEDGKTVSKPGTNPEAPAGTTKGLFRYWSIKNGNTETEYDFSLAVKSDLNLFAVYYDGYTVSFYDSDGTLLSSESAGTHNSYKITKPENPVSERDDEGSFKCWTLFDGTEWDFNNRVESNLNLYATYNKAYTVIFYNSEVIYTKEKVSEGETALRPETDPENINKGSLKGWTTNPNYAEANDYDFTSPVTEDTVLYAYFNEAEYVTLTDSNNNVLKWIKVDYNTPCPLPDITSVDKSVIEKWQIDLNKDGNWTDYDFKTPVTDNITLKADCYTKADESKVLGAMKFAEILARCTGNAEGTGTTSGFKDSDLLELFLSGLNFVEPSTLNYYFDYNGKRYYDYTPGSYIKEPDNLLYSRIVDFTVGRYTYVEKDEETEISADNLSIDLRLTKGKLDTDGNLIEDNTSEFTAQVKLYLTRVSLKIEKSGKVTLFTVDSSDNTTTTVMTSHVTDTSTGVDYRRTYTSAAGSTEETALHEDFCTVTFNPGNGESVETREVVKGTKITIGDRKPKDSYGSDTFLFWAKGGVGFDFDKEITENTVLEAVYTSHKDFMEKMLVAECIYRIPNIISGYDNVFRGTTTVGEIFPNTYEADSDLTKILLSSLFYADNSEKLYIPYNGKNYNYEDSTSLYTVYKLKDSIGKNESTKSGNVMTVKLEDFSLLFQYKYADDKGETWYLDKLESTFSIEATIETSGDTTITTAVLTVGSRTYPELKATKTTLPSGKEEAVYIYDGLTFTRIY